MTDSLVSCHSRVQGLQRHLVEMGRRAILTEPLHGAKHVLDVMRVQRKTVSVLEIVVR